MMKRLTAWWSENSNPLQKSSSGTYAKVSLNRFTMVDMSQTPMPRWDLYRNDRSVPGILQTSCG